MFIENFYFKTNTELLVSPKEVAEITVLIFVWAFSESKIYSLRAALFVNEVRLMSL